MKPQAHFGRWISAIRCGALFLVLLSTGAYGKDEPNIAAASDLRFALTEIADHFTTTTGQKVRLTFGSSGTLKTQIENGAPYQLFLSADEAFVFHLEKRGWTRGESRLYAIGQLALFIPHSASGAVKIDARNMFDRLPEDPNIKRFSMANPQHAPYGRAARSVLQTAGIWNSMKMKLVFGENASQAMQFVTSGASQAGIVPHSLSYVSELARRGTFHAIPSDWHADEPLRQRMVMLKKAGGTAELFFHFMQEVSAQSVLKRYGFSVPAERH